MANFGGFEVETPQEVLARLNALRTKVFSEGNINQQRQFNIEQGLDAVFGNPQVRDARRRMDAIQRAQTSAGPKQASEDDVDYEMRRLAAMRDAIGDISPDTASQINERLMMLGEQKFQRNRLKAADTRAEEEHKVTMDAARDAQIERDAYGVQTYVLDKQSGEAQAFNLRDPQQTAAFMEARQRPNTIVITPAQAAQIYMNDKDNEAAIKAALAKADSAAAGGSKVELQRLSNMSGGLFDLYATADRIFQVFDDNPDAITGSAKGGQALDRLATELGAAGRLATGAKLKDSDLTIDDWFKANAITSTRMQGLVVGLAYATAKANDPAGRISDKDLSAAMAMVGGNNPNPASILSNLNDNLTARTNSMLAQLSTASPSTREQLKDRTDLLQKQQETFKKRMAKYAQGSRGPAATGIAPLAAPDFETMTPEQLEAWATGGG